MPLSTIDFEYIRTLVRDRSAIALDEGKAYLAEARLANLARREGFTSLDALLAKVRIDRDHAGGLRQRVVEAMTTNESSFFRDVHPFEALRKVLIPDLIARRAGTRRIRIWCAACSSGQEPYSLAMLLREQFGLQLTGWEVSILATDLSSAMLERAQAGRYSQLEVNRGVPASLLVKAFRKEGSDWQLKDDVRAMVEFRHLNLIEPWPVLWPMDIVMLRNVLIYFETETKRQVLEAMARVLAPDGYLFLGAAETTLNLSESYDRVAVDRSLCYRPRVGVSRSV
jgi:chemotaxis protein methyltransferase CheR